MPLYSVPIASTGFVGPESPAGSGDYPRQNLRKITVPSGTTVTLRDGGASGTVKDVVVGPADRTYDEGPGAAGLEFETDLHVTNAGGGTCYLFFSGKQRP